ncbi:hypothetical protein GCM10007863_30060 [Dyella mobilis]|nr:hypothetical protein GCM10007863_30060 [Dyella mobilis]
MQPDHPTIGQQCPGDHGQGGRLAGAVYSKQPKHLARFQAQAQVAYGGAAGTVPDDLFKLQYGR